MRMFFPTGEKYELSTVLTKDNLSLEIGIKCTEFFNPHCNYVAVRMEKGKVEALVADLQTRLRDMK